MPAPATPARILVVDDDVGLTRLIERALKREGLTPAIATTGAAALRWLKENSCELMLLDLKLQDMEGGQLIQQLETAGRNPPFIIITGQGDERVAVDMMKRGALDYLVKDAQFNQYVTVVVRRALEKLETTRRLAETQAALDESRKQVLAISEREQRRIGAELHDGLGQQLTAIELLCQSLKEDLPAKRADLRKQVAQISAFLREAVAQTRAMARGLTPVQLGSGGLHEALEELAVNMSRSSRIQCHYESLSRVVVDNPEVSVNLFRIAQEAVNNAVKHSQASRVRIQLEGNPQKGLRLTVSDNGKGLLPTSTSAGGLGLQMMQHRADIIGATLAMNTTKSGLSVVCTLSGVTA